MVNWEIHNPGGSSLEDSLIRREGIRILGEAIEKFLEPRKIDPFKRLEFPELTVFIYEPPDIESLKFRWGG